MRPISDKALWDLCHNVTLAYESKNEAEIIDAKNKLFLACIENKEYSFLLLDETSALFWYGVHKKEFES